MTYVKINGQQYPARVVGRVADSSWGGRQTKVITLEMTHEEALATFVDGLDWSIVYQGEEESQTYDNGEYCMAGSITDNRDGTVTVKMGKITAEEALAELMEVLGE